MNNNTEQIVTEKITLEKSEILLLAKIVDDAGAYNLMIQMGTDNKRINYSLMDSAQIYMISGSIGKDVQDTEFISEENPNTLYQIPSGILEQLKNDIKENKQATCDIILSEIAPKSQIPKFANVDRSIITVGKDQLMTYVQTAKKIDHHVNLVLDMDKLAVGYERLDILEKDIKFPVRSIMNVQAFANIILPFKKIASKKIQLHIGHETAIRIQMGTVTADLAPRISVNAYENARPMHETKKRTTKADHKVTLSKQDLQTIDKLSRIVDLEISRLSDTDVVICGMHPSHISMVKGFIGKNAAKYMSEGCPKHLTWRRVDNNPFDDQNYLGLPHLFLLDRESYTFDIHQICKGTPNEIKPTPKMPDCVTANIEHLELITALKKISKTETEYGHKESVTVHYSADPKGLVALDDIVTAGKFQDKDMAVNAQSDYYLEYLINFLKAIPKQTKPLELKYGTEQVMSLQTTDDEMTLKFYLAPKIEN